MMKTMIACFLVLCCTVGCVKSTEKELSVHVKEYRNTIVDIDNCPKFIEDYGAIYLSLTKACDAAGFKPYRVHTESISKDTWVMYVYADGAYAALWIHKKDNGCTLEYCSTGIEYCYPDFLDTFMNEFYAVVETTDGWYQTFTELLE